MTGNQPGLLDDRLLSRAKPEPATDDRRPSSVVRRPSEPQSRFLRACRGLPVDCTPVWLMRQAGRYMAEYQAVRARYSLLEIINTPELAAEITLQPINAFDLDAAIIFADILPPLIGMGLKLEFAQGEGPVIHNRIERPYDVDVLAAPPAQEATPATLKAIELAAAELKPRGIPLIGFAGAPFTLASYAVEGGGSTTYRRVKAFMLSEPAAWKRLMSKLVTVQADYLIQQARAGAAALQLFDSWVGLALGQEEYRRYVQPYNKALFQLVAQAGVPVIHFSTGTAAYIRDVAACGDIVGVDWRMPLEWYWEQIGADRPIQGNLDPAALLAPWRELKHQVDGVLVGANGRPGHIFNLGHGVFKETPVDNVRRLVDYVHEKSVIVTTQ
ncbi:MAG: uroporphyrinogen decarboxylase [Chloroflexi bacterium]|nr:uroporphyrinogen decarboxylase [Chloroflexota bacterium]MCI0580461.1 uroporphyrinogen decarboxylase [Chloroflexota bacterium]MCI0649205.1 uroporphyrinogen decarboxylase [Chloroflexota bacterium]MCI0727983.1 uroporphyrinogen decarboxylase [Chloroflexota bacterium]